MSEAQREFINDGSQIERIRIIQTNYKVISERERQTERIEK